MFQKIVFLLSLLLFASSLSIAGECYMVLVGSKASQDGSVLLAHNDELKGHNCSLIEKTAHKKHPKGSSISFPTGLTIPQVSETFSMLLLRVHRGFIEGDAIAVNEHQVAIAGGVALGKDRNNRAKEAFPLVKKGLTGGVRYVALERSKTARQCVQTLGRLYSRYGVSYPSGVGVADTKEVWYIEAGGGRQWAALRIPRDKYMACANGYRIGVLNLRDRKNFLASPGLLKECKKKGLWNPKKGSFNFAQCFGGGRRNRYYDSRRVWGTLRLLSPSKKFSPYKYSYPMFLKPDKKITVQDLTKVLRDRYEGTPFANSFASGKKKIRERPIAVQQTVHTNVLQLRAWLPPELGALMWTGLGAPQTTIYTPHYYGIREPYKSYGFSSSKYSEEAAFWHFRALTTLVTPYYDRLIGEVLPQWRKFEEEQFKAVEAFEKFYLLKRKQNKDLATELLTEFCKTQAREALLKARAKREELETLIAKESYNWRY